MTQRMLRKIAGIIVLVIFAAIGTVLIPPYLENWKLQRYVNELVDDPGTAALQPEVIRAKVVSRAASLGLPVRDGDVQITRVQDAIRINDQCTLPGAYGRSGLHCGAALSSDGRRGLTHDDT